MKDITSGAGVKNALKRGAKRARKTILKRGTQRLMKGKGRTRSHSESIFQQQFGKYHGDDDCYSIYFDSSRTVGLSGLL